MQHLTIKSESHVHFITLKMLCIFSHYLCSYCLTTEFIVSPDVPLSKVIPVDLPHVDWLRHGISDRKFVFLYNKLNTIFSL